MVVVVVVLLPTLMAMAMAMVQHSSSSNRQASMDMVSLWILKNAHLYYEMICSY